MPALPPRRIRFQRSVPDEVVEAVAALEAAGSGWVNLSPEVDEDDLPPPSGGLGRLFGGTGPAVPHATWVAGGTRRDGMRRPSELGIEHASGSKAVARLRDAGVVAPQGWVVKQDHIRRGLVFRLPAGTQPAAIVEFVLAATPVLATVFTGGAWLADVYST